MAAIDRTSTVVEIAALVSQALERAGIRATLSGGAAVTIYSANTYASMDLDFITAAGAKAIESAVAPLGFTRAAGARQFDHPETDYYVEFPPGPVAFGETVLGEQDVATLQTDFGPIKIVSPTHSIMDRLAAYTHWHDNPSFDQAVLVARQQHVDWPALYNWADAERVDRGLIDKVRRNAERF